MNKDSPKETLNRTYLITWKLSLPHHLIGQYFTREDGTQERTFSEDAWTHKNRECIFPLLKWDKNKF